MHNKSFIAAVVCSCSVDRQGLSSRKIIILLRMITILWEDNNRLVAHRIIFFQYVYCLSRAYDLPREIIIFQKNCYLPQTIIIFPEYLCRSTDILLFLRPDLFFLQPISAHGSEVARFYQRMYLEKNKECNVIGC